MLDCCVSAVEALGEICVKFFCFCTFLIQNKSHVEKPVIFTTSLARLLHGFFHGLNLVFISVFTGFLPIINRTNNNDNYIKLTFNYWRI